MPAIDLQLPATASVHDVFETWPDLLDLDRRGMLVRLDDEHGLRLTVLPRGMESGRASICFRFQLPNRRVAIMQSSLRALWSATIALAARYGEDFMSVQPTNDVIRQKDLAIQELGRQLLAAKQRLGEPLTIDMSVGDKAWEAYAKARREERP